MTKDQAVRILETNRDANPNKPKFIAACNMAITALNENKPLKNRCRVLTQGLMCGHCSMQCPDLEEGE